MQRGKLSSGPTSPNATLNRPVSVWKKICNVPKGSDAIRERNSWRVLVAPTATLAQFPGPPPLPGAWWPSSIPWPWWYCSSPAGARSDFARAGGPSGFHGVDRAIQGSGRHFQGRTAGYTEGCSSSYGYDRGGWARRWGRYGAHVYGSYGYNGSDSYGYGDGDGCYYAYSRYAVRRVLVCSTKAGSMSPISSAASTTGAEPW
jgi:hypothetical protein